MEDPQQSPVIVTQPSSASILLAGNTRFSSLAYGSEPLHYQWRLNGTNLTAATNATFSRTNAQSSHAGSYSVVVSNLFGSVTSSVANLVVLSTPPVVTNQPAFLSTLSGGSTNLSVAASGDGPFTYQWRLNGTNLASATNANLSYIAAVLS